MLRAMRVSMMLMLMKHFRVGIALGLDLGLGRVTTEAVTRIPIENVEKSQVSTCDLKSKL